MGNGIAAQLIDIIRAGSYESPVTPDYLATNGDRIIWVMTIGKAELGHKQMTAQQIHTVLVDGLEVSVSLDVTRVTLGRLCRERLLHKSKNGNEVVYSVMAKARTRLDTYSAANNVNIHFFESGTAYNSKRQIEAILRDLVGEVLIVDPYIGQRTLDLLTTLCPQPIRLLTSLKNLHLSKDKLGKLQNDINDFCGQNASSEIRDGSELKIHDRYIISDGKLIILGHSIKDLGGKDSFAVCFDVSVCADLVKSLRTGFERMWASLNG